MSMAICSRIDRLANASAFVADTGGAGAPAMAEDRLAEATAEAEGAAGGFELGLVPPPPDHGEEEARKKEVIKAVLRPGSGKIQAKKERRLGRIPSIVFEQEDGHLGGRKRIVSVDRKQIGRLVKKFGRPFFVSQVFDLEIAAEGAEVAEGAEAAEGEAEGSTVEGARMRVIPKLVHWHGGTDEILNVTFLSCPNVKAHELKCPCLWFSWVRMPAQALKK
ncbi:unnamed protein product, partial [Closterium sp. Naga37s-1]